MSKRQLILLAGILERLPAIPRIFLTTPHFIMGGRRSDEAYAYFGTVIPEAPIRHTNEASPDSRNVWFIGWTVSLHLALAVVVGTGVRGF